MSILELRDQIPTYGGLIFYDLYTCDSFYKRKQLNLSDFTMKLIEELKNLLFWLELNVELT